LRANGIWATTLAYGSSHARELVAGNTLNAATAGALLESSVTVSDRSTVFVRGEVAGIPAHHLHAFEYSTSVFVVGKLQFGYLRQLTGTGGLRPGIGGSVGASLLPRELAPHYSGRIAPSFGIFFSLRTARHQM
jgi:hypothetical protein